MSVPASDPPNSHLRRRAPAIPELALPVVAMQTKRSKAPKIGRCLILRVDSEVCTGNSGQANNCWNTAHDTLADIDWSVLNDTYLSLSSARPSLSSWTFDPATQTSSSYTTPPSASATSTISPTSSPSSHISGGAIGGIVVGVVAVMELAAGFGVYFSRRRDRQKRVMILGESIHKDDVGVKVELSSQPRPQELSTDPLVAELEAGR
ncbi:hypothetical protein DL98DRAFT_622068 [Cadophora sp. DSE1049]|nr:hypothetical protein DL98DRAFT_622068 [Cadophora sp. DSE1049]